MGQNHIANVLSKCSKYLFLLSRIKSFLSIDNRKLFYNAYILPHFDYCCIIWGNCNSSLEDKLVKFQKRAARLILNADFTTPSVELFHTLRWMTFPERVIYRKALQMYQTIHGNAPEYLKSVFTFTSDIHTLRLRSSSEFQLYTPRLRLETFRQSFSFSDSLWLNIQNASSVHQFKPSSLKWFNF